jgi:thiamine biosynthesis protein ThiS
VQLFVNGQSADFAETISVAELLAHFRLPPQRVAVEVNQQLVRRGTFEQTRLGDGDRVEIVTFVGGG